MENNIFNYSKTDYQRPNLILGQEVGLFDTIHKLYPEIWKIYEQQRSLDWSFNEFNYSSCISDFKNATKSEYDMMIKTLAWQWEADSIATYAIAPVLAPFITSSELWAAWIKITEMEVTHAATYSEIVRNSFDDPKDILDEILSVQEAHDRVDKVLAAFNEGYKASHRYALGEIENNQETYNTVFKTIVALYCMERIQFMASFAVTFALCNDGRFQPIGKAIQKIAQDELECHAELDRIVLQYEMTTERGKNAIEQCRTEIKEMIDSVVESEKVWIDYLFSEGRELVGMNADRLFQWTLYSAKDVYHTLGIEPEHALPENNPLKFMEKWLDLSKNQPSPQEQDIAAYKVNILARDDENTEFDINF